MVARKSFVSLTAGFVAVAAVIGLLPLISDLLLAVQFVHPPPSQSERVLGGIRDLLFCSSLLLAYFMWLQRRTVVVPLCLTCIAIAGLTLLSTLLNRGRYLYANPVFDPMSSALQQAFPWFFLAALLFHPTMRDSFGEPVRIRFSVRWFLIVALTHVVLFITATSLTSVSPNAVETLLVAPGRILTRLIIRFGAGHWLLDGSLHSVVGPLLELFGSALAWGSIFALIGPRIGARSQKPSNQTLQPTADPEV